MSGVTLVLLSTPLRFLNVTEEGVAADAAAAPPCVDDCEKTFRGLDRCEERGAGCPSYRIDIHTTASVRRIYSSAFHGQGGESTVNRSAFHGLIEALSSKHFEDKLIRLPPFNFHIKLFKIQCFSPTLWTFIWRKYFVAFYSMIFFNCNITISHSSASW